MGNNSEKSQYNSYIIPKNFYGGKQYQYSNMYRNPCPQKPCPPYPHPPCFCICPAGAQGPAGETGPQGPVGPAGPQGPAGMGLSSYAYIYNLEAQVVAIEADVNFSDNGVIVGPITHAPGTASISLDSAGDYAIWFNVAGVEPNQFAIFQNGAPVNGSVYGSGAGTQPNPGMVIITASAGDVLTLRNHSSASAVTLQTLAGGTQTNANASIIIQKLNS